MPPRIIDTATEASGSSGPTSPLVEMMLCSGWVVSPSVIDSVYATIARGERVAITGFGVFERRERAARVARNPATGARVDVAASRVPAFRPGAEFKATCLHKIPALLRAWMQAAVRGRTHWSSRIGPEGR